MIKIDIWSDFVCPFCYIGKKQLDEVIEELGIKDQVKFNYMAYELHPDAPKKRGYSYMEDIYNQYPSKEIADNMVIGPMVKEAERLGFTMKFDDLDHQNTMDAHRIAKYAKFYNKDEAFAEACFEEVFGKNGFIAEAETLVRIATSVGLDEGQVREIINDEEKFRDIVLEDETNAEEIGIESVPFYIFNDKFGAKGAQGVISFKEILNKVREDAGLIDLSEDNSNTCGPEGC